MCVATHQQNSCPLEEVQRLGLGRFGEGNTTAMDGGNQDQEEDHYDMAEDADDPC